MFALFVISGIAALVCGCIGIFDISACVQQSNSGFPACRGRLFRGAALIVVPSAIMMLSMGAMFGW